MTEDGRKRGIEDNDEEDIVIVSVKQDRKSRKLYHLYAGEDEPFLSVHEDIWIRYRLMKGQTISHALLAEITQEDERYRAYILAIAYLGAKPRTRKQIEQYLMRKQFEGANIEYALDRLEREKIVDDEGYAKEFAAGRLRSSLKGRMLIKQELQQRGVSKNAAADAISSLGYQEELEAAKAAAEKKWRSLKGETFEKKRKLMGFLLRRGFPGSIAKEAINSVNAQDEPSDRDDDVWQMLDN